MQSALNSRCGRVRATQHAPRGPFRVLERRHGLADIIERGGEVLVDGHRVIRPQREREVINLAKNAPRHRDQFAHKRHAFLVALEF